MKIETNFRSKKCRVCGDKASGFNYCGLTCESCKIFFYRYQSKTLRCANEGRCEIDIVSRRICQQCRMEKCFSIGMRKTFSHAGRKVNGSKSPKHGNTLREILLALSQQADEMDCEKSLMKKHFKIQSSPFEIKQCENEQIKLIQSAISNAFEDEAKLEIVAEVSHEVALKNIQWPDLYARRIVRFCKNMLAFKEMNNDDQLIVLREFVIELFAVRISFLMDFKRNGYPVIWNETGSKAFFVKRQTCITTEYPEFKIKNENFINSLHWEMENDPTIRDLILSILLFQPREKILYPEFIKYQYLLHCRLLRKYLANKYKNMYRAMSKFGTLMNLLEYLKEMKENSKILFEENRNKVGPMPEIFIEAFDLTIVT